MQTSPSLFIGDLVQSRRVIYQASSFAMQNLLYLQETGSLTAIKPHTSSRQNLSSFLFFFMLWMGKDALLIRIKSIR
jgi:hypothetical protein